MRPARSADREGIFKVQSVAFDRDNEARLVERIEASDRAVEGLSLVAEADGLIVGYALFSHVGVALLLTSYDPRISGVVGYGTIWDGV